MALNDGARAWLAILSALGGATFAGGFLLAMGEPDRHSAPKYARDAVIATLFLTWSLSALLAFGFFRFAPDAETKKQTTFGLLFIIAPNVGGLLALTRSIRTRSETGATLRELSSIRVATLSAPLVEETVRLREVEEVGPLLDIVVRMLRLSVSLPLTRDVLDKAALWLKDDIDGKWFIGAETGASEDPLEMDVLTAPSLGKGIVANLAIAQPPDVEGSLIEQDIFICSRLQQHPWYVAKGTASSAEAMAAVPLRDGNGVTIGMLTLTTRQPGLVPMKGQRKSELIDILRFWSHSFREAVVRLREVSHVDGT